MPMTFKHSSSYILLGFLLGLSCSTFAQAQDYTYQTASIREDESYSTTPTSSKEQTQKIDIEPRPLTLADLEELMDGPQKKHETRGRSLTTSTRTTPVEDLYSRRADENLMLYGYDLFESTNKPSMDLPAGQVGDDYILGSGDILELNLRGQENSRKIYTINSQGQLVTDRFPSVMASGKTLGAVRSLLSDTLASEHNITLSLTLSQARHIDVLVIGEVEKPGRKVLTPFHTVLDALTEANGVRKTGSLRSIKLVRAGKSRMIDLYSVTMQDGKGADITLMDGDRLIVPPIGPVIAISGAVKRPAIYELKRGERLSTLEALGL